MTDYASRVHDLAERQEALRLYQEAERTQAEADKVRANSLAAPTEAEAWVAFDKEYRRRQQELTDWSEAERRRIEGPQPWDAAQEAADKAEAAYNAHPTPPLLDDSDGPIVCALSGAPLYDNDITIEIGGKTVLASLFVPPDVLASLAAYDGEEDD